MSLFCSYLGDSVPVADSKSLSITRGPISLWLPVVVWATLIAVATSIPGDKLPPSPISYFDIGVHVVLYGVLSFFLYRALYRGTRLGTVGWAWLLVFVLAQLYGVLDEIHQLWVPNRYCTVSDAVADGAGAALGVLIYFVWFVRSAQSVNLKATDSRP